MNCPNNPSVQLPPSGMLLENGGRVGVKVPVFSFDRLPGADYMLGNRNKVFFDKLSFCDVTLTVIKNRPMQNFRLVDEVIWQKLKTIFLEEKRCCAPS